jgi:hypothetical protein
MSSMILVRRIKWNTAFHTIVYQIHATLPDGRGSVMLVPDRAEGERYLLLPAFT